MRRDEKGTRFPLLLDLYAALYAAAADIRRAHDNALFAIVTAQTTAEGFAARSRSRGWLLRQFDKGTISWALVALLMLVTAGLMGLFSSLARA